MSRLDRRPPRLVVEPGDLRIEVAAYDDFRLAPGDRVELSILAKTNPGWTAQATVTEVVPVGSIEEPRFLIQLGEIRS